jgi:hypothetical protein
VAETNALLKRHTGNCIEGSNPSVSAKFTFADIRHKPITPGKQARFPGRSFATFR